MGASPPDLSGPFVPQEAQQWTDLIKAIANATISLRASPGGQGSLAFQISGSSAVLILPLGPLATEIQGLNQTITLSGITKLVVRNGAVIGTS